MIVQSVVLFSLFFIGSLFAEKMVFTGSAEIEHFDVEAARNKACIDALLQAAKYIQADLSGVNPDQKYETVYEEVLARTYGALKDIVFIKETQLDSYFVAKIQCYVDESKLDEKGKVMPPDLAKLDQIELPAAGPILEGSEKIAKKLLALFKHRKKKDSVFTVALLPFGNQRGQRSEEVHGYAEILFGRLFRFLQQDPEMVVLGLPQLEILAKEHEMTMESFDKPGAHLLVQKLGVEAVIVGRLDFLSLQDYKKADYFPVHLRIFFDRPGKVTQLHSEIRSEDKNFVGGSRIYSEKDARLNLNRIRNLFNNQNFSFDILVDGVPLKKYYIDNPVSAYIGCYFVESKPNQSFQIRISNQIYDKKSRRSAVGVLVDGKDCFYQEIKGKWIPIQTHHQEVFKRFLLEKETIVSGWQTPTGILPFTFQDQMETQTSGRLSIASVPGSITIFIYSQVLSSDQEGTAEGLMKDGELVDAKIPNTPLMIYSNPIAVFKIFYRENSQLQVLRNQGTLSRWQQLGTASYEKMTPINEQNRPRYKEIAEVARRNAQKQITQFFKENEIQYKHLTRKKLDFECIDNDKIFVRIDYTVLELKDLLDPFNENKQKLQNFLKGLEEGLQSWASESYIR